MLKKLAITAAVITSLFAVARPAGAAESTTTFTLTAGSLSISAPASASLGSAAITASSLSASLGTVTVTDNRGSTLGTWTASVSSTDFTTGGATANETIGKANIDYWSGAATSTTGTGVFTPGQLLVANAQDLSTSRTAFTGTALVGNNEASFAPTIVVNVPASAVSGAYSGTVTHSIA